MAFYLLSAIYLFGFFFFSLALIASRPYTKAAILTAALGIPSGIVLGYSAWRDFKKRLKIIEEEKYTGGD